MMVSEVGSYWQERLSNMSETESKAWDTVGIVTYSNSRQQADELYSEWAQKYDSDLDTLKYETPQNLVTELLKYIDNTPSTKVLDVAAGTGKCGEVFKKLGFKGIMDAIEINGAMLEIAKRKSLYRNHTEMGVYPDKSIPIVDGLYDAAVCAGSFGPHHLAPGCVAPISHTLRQGGVTIFSCRATPQATEYRDLLENEIDKLEKAGMIARIEVKEMTHYAVKCRETGNSMMSKVYVYHRL
ncbi:methyltransferase-like protein 27 [Styela clava]